MRLHKVVAIRQASHAIQMEAQETHQTKGTGMNEYLTDCEGEICPKCGSNAHSMLCERCGGDGETEPGYLYEMDPLWYDVDDTDPCSECRGLGFHKWCRDCGWDLLWNYYLGWPLIALPKAGAAEWTVNPQTGEKAFRWKGLSK